jgi:hypothetical protein
MAGQGAAAAALDRVAAIQALIEAGTARDSEDGGRCAAEAHLTAQREIDDLPP